MKSLASSLSFPALLVLFLFACGGPAEVPRAPGSSSGGSGDTCGCDLPGGTDSDGDGLSDECEACLGTPPDNPDCDGDGIGDSMDDPKDCKDCDGDGIINARDNDFPANCRAGADECDAACQANKQRMYQELADSLMLGSSMMTNTVPAGNTVQAEVMQLLLGQASLIKNPNVSPHIGCQGFLLIGRGTVNGRKAEIELCGSLTATDEQLKVTPDQKNLPTSSDLTGTKLKRWEGGWAQNYGKGGPFDPKTLSGVSQDLDQDFKLLAVGHTLYPCRGAPSSNVECHDKSDVGLYQHLNFILQSKFKVQFTLTNGESSSSTIRTETIQRNWKRLSLSVAYLTQSHGFMGAWTNCASLDPACKISP